MITVLFYLFVCSIYHFIFSRNFIFSSNSRFTHKVVTWVILISNIFIIFCISQYLPSTSHIIQLIMSHNKSQLITQLSTFSINLYHRDFILLFTSNFQKVVVKSIEIYYQPLANNHVAFFSSMPTKWYILWLPSHQQLILWISLLFPVLMF